MTDPYAHPSSTVPRIAWPTGSGNPAPVVDRDTSRARTGARPAANPERLDDRGDHPFRAAAGWLGVVGALESVLFHSGFLMVVPGVFALVALLLARAPWSRHAQGGAVFHFVLGVVASLVLPWLFLLWSFQHCGDTCFTG